MIIIKTDDTKHKCKKLEKVDSMCYCVANVNGKLTKVPLEQADIKAIRIKNESASTLLTCGIILVPIIFIVIGLIDLANTAIY